MVDELVLALEELGLGLIDEAAAPVDGAGRKPGGHGLSSADSAEEGIKFDEPASSALSSRDPVRMYLSQMGDIPLLSREREIFLAKQIEVTRKRFRRSIME